ncbi:MAG: hypothetical protein WAL32_00310 [Terriglobales bacterium]
MKRSLKLGVVLLMTLLLGGVFLALPAKSTRPVRASAVGGVPPGQPPTLIFNRALKSTSFNRIDCCQTLPGGVFVNIDSPLTFTCPGPGTCTLSAEMIAQAGGNSASENLWALVALVDGKYIGVGPFAGELLTDGYYSVTSWTDVGSNIAPGKHTIQSQIFTEDAAILGYAGITYRLYKP